MNKLKIAKTKNIKKIKNKVLKNNPKINIDDKMATKTMYSLMIKQSNYPIAKKILQIMIINNRNKTFAQKELKKIRGII